MFVGIPFDWKERHLIAYDLDYGNSDGNDK